ncbi:MAG TPA: class I SAM-dependent methyltransferase [Candidatus Lokiarchaeia archaeon]|nr:class I SAM-dependent methyltransferase [Candidatus Lokiarchaeia archaeon]
MEPLGEVRRYYDYVSQFWDRMYADNVPYAAAFAFIDRLREELRLGKSILDVACGTGLLLQQFKDEGYETWGSDLSPEMLALAKKKLGPENLQLADYHDVTVDTPVDVIVSFFNSFHYCLDASDLRVVLTHLREFLVPGGLLVFDLHTDEDPQESIIAKTYKFPEALISHTIVIVPQDGVFHSEFVFVIYDRVAKERHIVTRETDRGIYSHQEVLECIANAGFEDRTPAEGYMGATETFVARVPLTQ